MIIKNKNNFNKEKYLNNIYITYNRNNEKNTKNKTPIKKLKKIYRGKNNIKKNYSKYYKSLNKIDKNNLIFYPKIKFSNSSNNNSYSLLNKMSFNNYRKTTTNNGDNKNNLNFSYLWLNNRDSHYLSKSYINPFNKIESKKSKKIHNLNIVTS